ncbi:MAG: SHD1 domain-containing protein [Planctomycetaceae bacterium]
MKYALADGASVHYRVTIVVDTPGEKNTMSGVISYTGKGDADGQLKLEYSGGLQSRTQSKSSGPPRGFRGPGRPGGPPPGLFNRNAIRFDGLTNTTSLVTIRPNGEVVSMQRDSQIPYMLGNLSILPLEALADDAQASWRSGQGITVTEQEDTGFGGGPFREVNKTVKTGGSEETRYKIARTEGDLVHVTRNYKLTSPAIDAKDSAVTITGEGAFVFNRRVNMPESLDMKYDYQVEIQKTKISVPITVGYTRLTDEQYREHSEKQEFAKKNPGINTQGKPWTEAEQDEIIKELQSTDVHVVQRRLAQLAARKPFLEEKRVAEVILPLAKQDGQTGRMATMAWKTWKVAAPEMEAENLKRIAAEKAMKAGDNPFEPDRKPALSALRTWTDNTGSFKVEAEFIALKGTSVTLKRKADGKELELPLERLSAADQKAAQELAKQKSAAPKNPFE